MRRKIDKRRIKRAARDAHRIIHADKRLRNPRRKVARTVAFWSDEKANTHKRTASRAASLQEMERELRGAKR